MDSQVAESFDLEQEILDCWGLTNHLKTLYEEVCNGEISKDDIANILLGLTTLYEIKFNKTFLVFEKVHRTVCKSK